MSCDIVIVSYNHHLIIFVLVASISKQFFPHTIKLKTDQKERSDILMTKCTCGLITMYLQKFNFANESYGEIVTIGFKVYKILQVFHKRKEELY